ncbi:MAG: hypothetical protein Kow0068_16810 [Marinilabiliales bacterium]
MKYKKFKQLLAQYSNLPIKEQRKKLEEDFSIWKGDYAQTDVVLLIGIKL